MEELLFTTYPLFEAFKILKRHNPQIDSIETIFILSNQGRLQLSLFLNNDPAILLSNRVFQIDLDSKPEINRMKLLIDDKHSILNSEVRGLVEFSKKNIFIDSIALNIKKFHFYTDEYHLKKIVLSEMQVEYENKDYYIHAVSFGQVFITKENIESFFKLDKKSHIDEPRPVKGDKNSLMDWVKWKVENEGMDENGNPVYGFQAKLICEGFERFDYSESSIKTAWRKAGFTKK